MELPRAAWMSFDQWIFCLMKGNGWTYAAIRAECKRTGRLVPSDEALTHCFRRTAHGLYWTIGYPGGSDPYLCDEDAVRLFHIIQDLTARTHSISTRYILNIVYGLKIERAHKAVYFLKRLGCPTLAEKVNFQPPEPTRDWLRGFCSQYNIDMQVFH